MCMWARQRGGGESRSAVPAAAEHRFPMILACASVMMMMRCSVVVLFASLQRWQPSSCAAAAAQFHGRAAPDTKWHAAPGPSKQREATSVQQGNQPCTAGFNACVPASMPACRSVLPTVSMSRSICTKRNSATFAAAWKPAGLVTLMPACRACPNRHMPHCCRAPCSAVPPGA